MRKICKKKEFFLFQNKKKTEELLKKLLPKVRMEILILLFIFIEKQKIVSRAPKRKKG